MGEGRERECDVLGDTFERLLLGMRVFFGPFSSRADGWVGSSERLSEFMLAILGMSYLRGDYVYTSDMRSQ